MADRNRFSVCRRQVMKAVGLAGVAVPSVIRARTSAAQPVNNLRRRRAFMDDAEGGQIHYWTAGAGPALMLIHQSNNSSDEFIGIIPYLADKFRLIAIDLPGHGLSDDPAGPHTMERLRDAVIRLADHLDVGRFHLLGHHGGCLVVSSVAATVPNRIDRVIMSGTSFPRNLSEEEKAEIRSVDRNTFNPDWEGNEFVKIWRGIARMRSEGAEPKDLVTPFLNSLRIRQRPYEAWGLHYTWDRTPAQLTMKMPVLLIQGELDEVIKDQERLLERFPNGTRITLSGCNVFLFYDRPADCAKVIEDYLV